MNFATNAHNNCVILKWDSKWRARGTAFIGTSKFKVEKERNRGKERRRGD